jgi:TonB family protein
MAALLGAVCLWMPRVRGQAVPSGNDDVGALLLAAGEKVIPESASTPPFHLQAKFETFDITGKHDGDGTLDAYWDGKARWKHIVAYRGATQTRIKDDQIYGSVEPFPTSAMERYLIQALFAPLPKSPGAANSLDFTEKPQTFSGVAMNCIEARVKPAKPGAPRAGSNEPSRYCITAVNNALRVTLLPGNIAIVYNKFQPFGPRAIARAIDIRQGTIARASMEIQHIAAWEPDDTMLVHAAGMEAESSVATGDEVMAGSIVSKEAPEYPYMARMKHISGTVVLAAIISKQGTISDAEVVSSPDPLLSDSALAAVKKWRYKPYLLNGQPTEVDTTISVHYNFGQQ